MDFANISHHSDDLIDLRPDLICHENILEELRNLKSDFLILTNELNNIKMARKMDLEEMNNIKISNKKDLDEIGIKFSNKITTMNFMINQKQKESTESFEQKWIKFQEENFANIHRFKEQIIAKFIVENNKLKMENAKLMENIEELKMEIGGIKSENETTKMNEKRMKKKEMKKKKKLEKEIKKLKKAKKAVKKVEMDEPISNCIANEHHEEPNGWDLDGLINVKNSRKLKNENTNMLIEKNIMTENNQESLYNMHNPPIYRTIAYLNNYAQTRQWELLRSETFDYTVDFEPKQRRMIAELMQGPSGKKFLRIYNLKKKYDIISMDPNEIKLFAYFPSISVPADAYILLNAMRALQNDLEEIKQANQIRNKNSSLICHQLTKGGFRYDYKLEFHLYSKTKQLDFRMDTVTTKAKPTHKSRHLFGPIPIEVFHWLKEQMTEMLIA